MADWPTAAEKEAMMELIALADAVNEDTTDEDDPEPLSGKDLVKLYLDVEAILMRHDVNPRKLIDAIDHEERRP